MPTYLATCVRAAASWSSLAATAQLSACIATKSKHTKTNDQGVERYGIGSRQPHQHNIHSQLLASFIALAAGVCNSCEFYNPAGSIAVTRAEIALPTYIKRPTGRKANLGCII